MGYYINPSDGSTKEAFLAKFGAQVTVIKENFDFDGDVWPVCLVDNGPFTAAGICYCRAELECFQYPDGRMKGWFLVRRVHLEEFCQFAKRQESEGVNP